MFDSLKKKLQSSIKILSRKVEQKQEEPSFEKEEEFLHEEKEEPEQFLREEPEKIEKEEESEEHFDEEEPPEKEKPELGKETLEERELPEEKPSLEDKILEKEELLEKKGFLGKLRSVPSKVTEKSLSPQDIEDFFSEVEADLLYANVAVETVDFMKEQLKKQLAEKKIKRGKTAEVIQSAFKAAILKTIDHGEIDLDSLAKNKKPATLLFLGFNGSGKTTSMAKVASYLMKKKYKVVFAAADTFRAASIEQLEVHGEKLKIKTIKHKYGGDPAAVVFDAKKHAEASHIDFVLADTAGRTHVDKNLIEELKKIVRVNKPDLKILVIDSLTGNDAVEQAKLFHEAVGVDAVILTKIDVNKKGGSLLSVSYAIKKPILFLGTGQKYEDILKFEPGKFVDDLLS